MAAVCSVGWVPPRRATKGSGVGSLPDGGGLEHLFRSRMLFRRVRMAADATWSFSVGRTFFLLCTSHRPRSLQGVPALRKHGSAAPHGPLAAATASGGEPGSPGEAFFLLPVHRRPELHAVITRLACCRACRRSFLKWSPVIGCAPMASRWRSSPGVLQPLVLLSPAPLSTALPAVLASPC